jgi:hypothetical protein
MRILLIAAAVMMQFGPRPPLAPAETLLEPAILRAIEEQAPDPNTSAQTVGSDREAGWVLLTCRESQCGTAARAARKLSALVASKRIPQPTRSIRVVSSVNQLVVTGTAAAVHVAESKDRPLQVVRGLWSTASIVDEVVEVFVRHGGFVVDARPFEDLGQLPLDPHGIPTTTIVVDSSTAVDHAAAAAAASAYFLATLPNAGAEALLSHLTVGAHARLAEDGRRAVAQMGTQQRASADVLIMFGQAIEREQRRMRSLERFMPEPVDPMLRSRIADMEKGITSVWTSMGITSAPYVPPAERIRGRGGEDRRVPIRTGAGPLPTPEPPTAFLRFPNVNDVIYELGNFIDGKRSISDIRDALSAEFGPLPLPSITDYFDRLAATGAVIVK